jgi:predicted HAD superfamily Cof-like phosphohydrolase
MPVQNDNDDVGIFHTKFGLDNTIQNKPGPRIWNQEQLEFRLKFLKEELQEFEDGMHAQDPEQMFDALLDLVYVAHGTSHLLGFPWREGWAEVQRANMTKERCKIGHKYVGDPHRGLCDICAQPFIKHGVRGSLWDVIKPAGWTPPDIRGILKKFGWDS